MVDWFVSTLRKYPEIAIFMPLAVGYHFGSVTYKGLGPGAVTATLQRSSSDSLGLRFLRLSRRRAF